MKCVIEILDALMDDEAANFYPFEYERITEKQKAEDGYPRFIPYQIGFPFSGLVWNNERLNLSVQAKVAGWIDLSGNDVDLPEQYPTHIYRTFTIIKDGDLHIDKLPFACSPDTIVEIADAVESFSILGGVASGVLDFTRVPIINLAIVNSVPSVDEFCDWIYEKTQMHGIMKAIKHVLREAGPEPVDDGLSPDQSAYLRGIGATKDAYRPPSRAIETGNYYMAPTLRFYVKGCSSLPSVNVVMRRLADDGPLTHSMGLVRYGMRQTVGKTNDQLLSMLGDVKDTIRDLGGKINRAKMAIILGDRWFKGVPRKQEGVLNDRIVYKFGQKRIPT